MSVVHIVGSICGIVGLFNLIGLYVFYKIIEEEDIEESSSALTLLWAILAGTGSFAMLLIGIIFSVA